MTEAISDSQLHFHSSALHYLGVKTDDVMMVPVLVTLDVTKYEKLQRYALPAPLSLLWTLHAGQMLICC